MSEAALPNGRAEAPRGTLPALSLAALGVVFGDIGTSPLYTLKTVLDATGAHPFPHCRARLAFPHRLDAAHHHHGEICHARHAHRQ